MDIRLALMTGIDIPIEECKIILHQPTIKEISYIGESDFFVGYQTLTIYKNMIKLQDESVLDNVNSFQVFMTIMKDKNTADKKACVKKVLSLIFPKYKILFTPRSLVFQGETENQTVDESNFESLQSVIRSVFCAKTGPMDQQSFNPANQKAKEIADKLMRGRQKVAEQKGSTNISIFSLYLSSLSVALHIPITELQQYTMYQLYDNMERYSLYVEWDLYVRARLAGGEPSSQPENWMKNIH